MDDIFELLNYAYSQTKTAQDRNTTYNDDTEADHADGHFCGEKEAYNDLVQKCAEIIAKRAPQL